MINGDESGEILYPSVPFIFVNMGSGAETIVRET